MAGDYGLFRNVGGAWRDDGWFYGGQPVNENLHLPGCMCAYCGNQRGGTITVKADYAVSPNTSRLGWICSRCNRSVSPDVTVCPCETCGE